MRNPSLPAHHDLMGSKERAYLPFLPVNSALIMLIAIEIISIITTTSMILCRVPYHALAEIIFFVINICPVNPIPTAKPTVRKEITK